MKNARKSALDTMQKLGRAVGVYSPEDYRKGVRGAALEWMDETLAYGRRKRELAAAIISKEQERRRLIEESRAERKADFKSRKSEIRRRRSLVQRTSDPRRETCCVIPSWFKAPAVPMPEKKPDMRRRELKVRAESVSVMDSLLMANLAWKLATGRKKK